MLNRVLLHLLFILSYVYAVAIGSNKPPANSTTSSSILFLENKGQWKDSLKFKADINDGTLYLLSNKLIFAFTDHNDIEHLSAHGHDNKHPEWDSIINSHVISIDFLSQKDPNITGSHSTITNYNFIHGNDSGKWGIGVKAFQNINYNELYEGIDLEIKKGIQNIKYEYHLQPHAKPSTIQMKYSGTDELKIIHQQLYVKTSVNEWYEQTPYAYQIINDKKRVVKCHFTLKNNTVGFSLGNYNKNYELIIDPELIFSTSSGSTADNWGNTACFDEEGNLYSGGTIWQHNARGFFDFDGFPSTVGAIQSSFRGRYYTGSNSRDLYSTDMGILKFDSSGTQLLFATYLGGNDGDVPTSIVVNKDGNLIILGTTGSTNFPGAVNTFHGGVPVFPVTLHYFFGGTDIIVTELDGTTGGIVYNSRYIGGSFNDGLMNRVTTFITPPNTMIYNSLVNNYGDQFRGDVNIDKDGNIYAASVTNSNDVTHVNPLYPAHSGGFYDALVFKLNPDMTVNWSTYLGGPGDDAAYGIILDSVDNVYISGGTLGGVNGSTATFPTTPGALNTSPLGTNSDVDGFISCINSDGNSLLYSTFIGTDKYDQTYFVQIDQAQNVYTYGQTKGDIKPTPGSYGVQFGGQFIQKLSRELDANYFTSTFGSDNTDENSITPNISPTAFLVNDCGNMFMSGWGGLVNDEHPFQVGPDTYLVQFNGGLTKDMYISSDAYRNESQTDESDFYLMVLQEGAQKPLFGSYFGGNDSEEHVDGGTSRFSKEGIVYQSACANCGGNIDFPTSPDDGNQNTYPMRNKSGNCNNGVFKYDLANLKAGIEEVYNCLDLTAIFTNTSVGGSDFTWEFGDGRDTFLIDPTPVIHTYEKPGKYKVRLVASDITTCIGKDTAEVEVTIIDFVEDSTYYDTLCKTETKEISVREHAKDSIYSWSPATYLNDPNIPNPTISNPNTSITYIVTITDTMGCARYDTVKIIVPDPKVSFTWQVIGTCLNGPPEIQFINTSTGTVKYFWDFGYGATSTLKHPKHRFPTSDSSRVILTAGVAQCLKNATLNVGYEIVHYPNIITPNKDGKNETYIIDGLEGTGNWSFEVHDRWGKELYKNENYDNSWSGDYLSDGTYYYLIIAPDGTQCKGWVQIVK